LVPGVWRFAPRAAVLLIEEYPARRGTQHEAPANQAPGTRHDKPPSLVSQRHHRIHA
jgi:hypothetical protein